MASILPFIHARADFDDETTWLMGEAFDAARTSLDGEDEPELFYESATVTRKIARGKPPIKPIRN